VSELVYVGFHGGSPWSVAHRTQVKYELFRISEMQILVKGWYSLV